MLISEQGLAADRVIDTEAGKIKFETVAKGSPTLGLAFLPDGDLLVTERPGRLRLVSKTGEVSKPLTGVPESSLKGKAGCSTWRSTPISHRTALSISPTPSPAS